MFYHKKIKILFTIIIKYFVGSVSDVGTKKFSPKKRGPKLRPNLLRGPSRHTVFCFVLTEYKTLFIETPCIIADYYIKAHIFVNIEFQYLSILLIKYH